MARTEREIEPENESKLIPIAGDYFLGVDRYNFIVMKKIKNNDSYIYRAQGYFSNLGGLISYIGRDSAQSNIELLKDLEAHKKLIDEAVESINKAFKGVTPKDVLDQKKIKAKEETNEELGEIRP